MKIKKSGAGFSLIELVIYLFLSILLVALVFKWIIALQADIKRYVFEKQNTVSLHTALDVMMRDLSMTPCLLSEFKKSTAQEIIWRYAKEDIGWTVDKKNLYRTTGNYDQAAGTWTKKNQSVVYRNVQGITFEYNYYQINNQRCVRAIGCAINQCKRFATLHNRVVQGAGS